MRYYEAIDSLIKHGSSYQNSLLNLPSASSWVLEVMCICAGLALGFAEVPGVGTMKNFIGYFDLLNVSQAFIPAVV